ncbi:hypothetical protein B7494_g7502 [Chlorociboria aeruginascens]|nr:hypothetical protein B7494_g7502 [Chlorociboria aeruginascens]
MCGIYASISTRAFRTQSRGLKQLLCNRGPDHIGEVQTRIDSKDGSSYYLSFTSTVLALRGGHITTQPFLDPWSGSLLCWNGEAWKIGSETIVGNDGQAVFELLLKESSSHKRGSESCAAVLTALRSISGPFAFVFLDKVHGQIYFGRDRLGRRSLLYNSGSHPDYIEFSSTADPDNGAWQEVEADAVYLLASSDEAVLPKFKIVNESHSFTPVMPLFKYPWEEGTLSSPISSIGIFNRSLPAGSQILNPQSAPVQLLQEQLIDSLKLRILNVPVPPDLNQVSNTKVAVLFSGGLDCTVLARMAHDLLPLEEHIDLINVAFENPRVIQAAKSTPKPKKIRRKMAGNQEASDHLLIGNLDPKKDEISHFESCPDRETGRKAFKELQHVCPDRTWRFVAVNIFYTETLAHRNLVTKLIHPHNTEMDLSIAYALYFAARGTGIASSLLERDAPYTTPARVLLSGLGADELFGGYTRHATAFNRRGFSGLLDELELDVNRLGKRNLGRDDRVISHWGREARFPYLDESLMKRAIESPIWEKCGFGSVVSDVPEVPEIEHGKKVLRLLAYNLGMHSVAQEKKRAIQFGARTAKMEIGRTKDTAELNSLPSEAHSICLSVLQHDFPGTALSQIHSLKMVSEKSGVLLAGPEKRHDLGFLKTLEEGGSIYKDTARHNITRPAEVGGMDGLQYNIDLASRFQKRGYKICLDLQFSNSWADPQKQLLLAAWPTMLNLLVRLLEIFAIEMAILSRLVAKFNSYYVARPVLTMMMTNAMLGGIADTVAQSITAIRLRALRKPGGITKDDTIAIEIHELDRKNPFLDRDLIPDSKGPLPSPFDFERLTRFMAYGFCMAPLQFKWFQFLSRAFPITKQSALLPAMKMVAMDQLIFAPGSIACFFTVMTVAEGGGKRAVSHKLRDMYLPTLKANFMVWPLVQIINFRIMPIQFQLPFVSTVGIAWTAYLSLSNASEEVDARSAPNSPSIRLV